VEICRKEADFNGLEKCLGVKGQAAIEYMTVFGIALLLAAPFVMKAQSSIMEIQSKSSFVSMQDSLNDIDVAVRTVSASGEPAARTFEVRIPESVNETDIREQNIVVRLNTPTGTERLSRNFETNLTGNLPSEPGLYLLRVRAEAGEVDLEVVS
jgi:hypothetical protein